MNVAIEFRQNIMTNKTTPVANRTF